MWFSSQSSLGSRLKTGRHSEKRLANGGWNMIIKRSFAYRKYVTARRFPKRRSVFSLEPRLEFARKACVNTALSREPHTLSPLSYFAIEKRVFLNWTGPQIIRDRYSPFFLFNGP